MTHRQPPFAEMKRVTDRILGGHELHVRLPEQFHEASGKAVPSKENPGQSTGGLQPAAPPGEIEQECSEQQPFQKRLV